MPRVPLSARSVLIAGIAVALAGAVAITFCAPGPRPDKPLPDLGPTTIEAILQAYDNNLRSLEAQHPGLPLEVWPEATRTMYKELLEGRAALLKCHPDQAERLKTPAIP